MSSPPGTARSTAAAAAVLILTTSALTASAIFTYQAHTRKRRRKHLQDSISDHQHTHQHGHSHSHSHQPSSASTATTTDGGTPRYLSQLQLHAAAAAAAASSHTHSHSHSHSHRTPIPPPLLPTRPHRTSSSSSLRSSTSTSTATTLVPPAPSTPTPSHSHTPSRFSHPYAYPESLIREQLARHYSFFSPATLRQQRSYLHPTTQDEEQDDHDNDEVEGIGMPAIRNAYIIVVGLGGVGSHAALALLRSGISHLRLIDFDQVSLSSLNRHACATLADVGRAKVTVCQEKFAAIAPWATVDVCNQLFRGTDAPRLLTSPRRPDFIIDAIDNIDTKVDLLHFAYTNDIRIITASGAGAKSDPSRIQIADLSATSEDPLARAVRRRLRALGVPRLRDKIGDGHGSIPRARTLRKKETALLEGEVVHSPAPISSRQEGEGEYFTTEDAGPAQPLPPRPAPAPSARMTHSRRASSTSSMGNTRYATPMMSPSDLARDSSSSSPAPPLVLELDKEAISKQREPDDASPTTPPEDQQRKRQSKGRKPHSHALTPASLALSNLQHATPTGASLTLPCVFSTEKSDVRLLDLPASELGTGRVEELAALEDFRVRVLPVLGTIPAMFGMAAASFVLCEIAGWPMEPLPFLNRRKMYEKMLSDLEVCERRYPHSASSSPAPPGTAAKLPFSLTDITYLTEEVFHSRSCIPPFATLTTAASLLRWDSTLPLGFNNVVLMEREEGKVHVREVLKAGRSPWEVWGRAAAEEVKRRMAVERRMGVFR